MTTELKECYMIQREKEEYDEIRRYFKMERKETQSTHTCRQVSSRRRKNTYDLT